MGIVSPQWRNKPETNRYARLWSLHKIIIEQPEYTIKEQTARELIEQGQGLLILSEVAFYECVIEQLQQTKKNLEWTNQWNVLVMHE